MRIIVNNENEIDAVDRVMSEVMNLIASLAISIDNADEYILINELDNLPMEIDKNEAKLTEQFPELYDEYRDDY
jgi:hypothetical protein